MKTQKAQTEEPTIDELLAQNTEQQSKRAALRALVDLLPTGAVLAMAGIVETARSRDYDIKQEDFITMAALLERLR